ncbi:hypothetical protein CAPTEDRAFT_145469 [Capitella teleta]|uniref:Uncharacterized protein n=1 Tax=Capitella teleta TaxID=283909 RepID=R7TTK9_CAPTE|nr:hypothetical protein CAPTEDRAFT_145469 [Capitella teleta]|eukprot:ELT94330.1 hypothetical protein CAPTEDRAFT_145469 [Capitella teleta]
MQVLNPNNVKIYNLSAGKSLPEWLSDRKRRALQKNDLDVRRRIELIQDFEMPSFSTSIQATPDEQYIMATGMYKPMVRCYELKQMSMKFERCLDCEIIKFCMLSDDYSKMALMQSDRYIEFHSQASKYYRIRIPKAGRDMAYHTPSCDLYMSAVGPEVYRLNLEQGRFLKAIRTDSMEVKCCELNPVHHLLGLGTAEGQVECWDPRTKKRVGLLDSAISSISEVSDIEGMPAVTALTFQGGLTMGVGMSTGQVLLYDLRSNKPFLVKDHNYGLPIKKVVFHDSSRLVLSQDSRILKIWEKDSGKAFTSIEPGVNLNDLCVLPNSGLLFMTNESPKILSYYIPSLGPAPKWCSFLDSLTEEMEENPAPTVYDDYKFVTRTELDGLGLTHLIGSKMLRGYMHGYFLDVRLYHKAKSLTEPFAYDEHRKKKIQEKIDETRQSRVQVNNLPKVNRALAEKLLEQEEETTAKKKVIAQPANLLKDSRFADMFKDSAFQVDTEADEYKLLNPLVTKLEKNRKKKDLQQEAIDAQFEEVEVGGGGGGDIEVLFVWFYYRRKAAAVMMMRVQRVQMI